MTQPDPDPTNRELVRVLAEHTSKLSIHTMHQFLAAADAAGYQIVPKVELEGHEELVNDLVEAVTWHSNDAAAEGSRGDRLAAEAEGYREALVVIAGTPTKSSPQIAHDMAAAALQALDKENDG